MLNSSQEYIKNLGEFDSSELEISLTINGVSVRTGDFNKVMDDWEERIIKYLEEKMGVLKEEDSVEERAIALLKKKCHDAMELLYSIEESAYNVYE